MEEENKLPEAPLSIHIDTYKKGFHVGFTIRSNDNSVIPADKISGVIDSLIEKGFEPSWNPDTNKAHTNPEVKDDTPVCPTHNKKMKLMEGRWGTFWNCGTPLGNGKWCNYRPEKNIEDLP